MSAEIETLHKPFRAWLDKYGVCYTYHRPDKLTGATLGDADFICYNSNRVLMLEFKDKETRVSNVQKKRHAELLRAGCVVHICRTLSKAMVLTTEWLGTFSQLPSAVTPLPADKNPVAGVVGGKESTVEEDARQVTEIVTLATKDFEKVHSPVNGTERIGMWNTQRWLIRKDAKGREALVRPATPEDIARVGMQQAKP